MPILNRAPVTVTSLLHVLVVAVLLSGLGLARAQTAPANELLDFDFALYFAPKPIGDPEKELARLLAEKDRRLGAAGARGGPFVAIVRSKWLPLSDYAPPDAEAMRYRGVGVVPADAAKLREAEKVFIVEFSTIKRFALPANRAACDLLRDLSAAVGGVIWDEETRQVFSTAEWKRRRIDTWQGGLPDVAGHVTMDAYANPDLIRVITLGLRKFGQPDLVVQGIPNQLTRPIGNCINATMQRLVEGAKPEHDQLQLTLGDIRHEAVRTRTVQNPGPGATGTVLVSLKKAAPEEGDPHNTLWRLDFPEAEGSDVVERAHWALARLFGSTERVIGAKADDQELKAARDRARQAFFAQEMKFRAGLAFNEHLVVKAPFSERGQTEYMWVEVVHWGPDYIEGILSSDPDYVKSLKAGATVKVALRDVYDYLFYKADGTTEGNETGKLLESREH